MIILIYDIRFAIIIAFYPIHVKIKCIKRPPLENPREVFNDQLFNLTYYQDSLFSDSDSLVGPVREVSLTINYFVSSNFVVVSSTFLQVLSILVSLLSCCE